LSEGAIPYGHMPPLYGWARVPAKQGISPATMHKRVMLSEGASPLRTTVFQSSGLALEGMAIRGSELSLHGWALVQPSGIGRQSNRREQYPMGTCPLRTIEFQSSRRALEGIAIAGSELYLYGWALVQPLCIGRGGCRR